MSIAYIASTIATGNSSGGTTSAIDTTGANLIVLAVSYFSATTISDSYGNTWTALSPSTAAGGNPVEQLFYCPLPIVGSGHTFTALSYPAIYVLAVSGASATPLDQQNGATGSATSLQPGSITPTQNGCLIVTGIGGNPFASGSISGAFSALTADLTPGVNEGGGGAYEMQPTAVAVNPTWSWTGSGSSAAVIASFLPAAGGGPVSHLFGSLGVGK